MRGFIGGPGKPRMVNAPGGGGGRMLHVRRPGKAKPYPGPQQIAALIFLRSRLALRLAGMTMGADGRDDDAPGKSAESA